MTDTTEAVRDGRPRDAIELVLLHIWRDHLRNPALGVDDDYFAQGGTSLQAVRTLSEIRRRTGVSLPLPAMARAGSVTAMARLLRDGYADTPTPLVPIRPGSPGGPVVACVHPLGGSVLWYRHLADALPRGHTCVGLQARALDPRLSPDHTIGEMAAAYRAELACAYRPEQLVLVGYSFGGLVAYEMASRMADDGERPAAVVLLDTAVTRREQPPASRARLLWSLVNHNFGLDLSADELAALSPDAICARILDEAITRGVLPPGFGPDRLRRLVEIYPINAEAERLYRLPTYPWPLDLVRPREPRVDAESLEIWSEQCPAGVRVHRVPGSHLDLLAPSHAPAVAEVIAGLPSE
ncbi:alpha/beta fold hydrolase [Micromonospora sp. WMMD998]|uniref:thioesterase domain-containing protein n=1 Tax=Micromonospora sp. WMMD998 TaxID=3016092 RepID=UPI00249A229C|nr:alpha/beta fold hydrolase [Micromonospora sp. WMMD998]WFE41075.1 thioesterase domain-containing protein [Micromonospora sp. WMMD998]